MVITRSCDPPSSESPPGRHSSCAPRPATISIRSSKRLRLLDSKMATHRGPLPSLLPLREEDRGTEQQQQQQNDRHAQRHRAEATDASQRSRRTSIPNLEKRKDARGGDVSDRHTPQTEPDLNRSPRPPRWLWPASSHHAPSEAVDPAETSYQEHPSRHGGGRKGLLDSLCLAEKVGGWAKIPERTRRSAQQQGSAPGLASETT